MAGLASGSILAIAVNFPGRLWHHCKSFLYKEFCHRRHWEISNTCASNFNVQSRLCKMVTILQFNQDLTQRKHTLYSFKTDISYRGTTGAFEQATILRLKPPLVYMGIWRSRRHGNDPQIAGVNAPSGSVFGFTPTTRTNRYGEHPNFNQSMWSAIQYQWLFLALCPVPARSLLPFPTTINENYLHKLFILKDNYRQHKDRVCIY